MDVSRKCTRCLEIKSLSCFYPDIQNGKYVKKQKRCKTCQQDGRYLIYGKTYKLNNRTFISKYEITRRQKYKDRAIKYLGNKCAKCLLSFPLCVYDFHHLNPEEKENTISKLLQHDWKTIKKELDKCILLCANCHRLTHWENKWQFPSEENEVNPDIEAN